MRGASRDPDAAEVPRASSRSSRANCASSPTDADLPKDERNTRIDESFVARARPELPPAGKFEDVAERPAGAAAESELRGLAREAAGRGRAEPRRSARGVAASPPRRGSRSSGAWLPGKKPDECPWLIVLNPGEDAAKLPAWARDLVGTPRSCCSAPGSGRSPGRGASSRTRSSVPFPLVGGTIGQRPGLGRADRRPPARPGEGGWRIAGRGQAGIVAAYAALFEPAIEEVVAVDPPPSHLPLCRGAQYGPPLLNVLRVLDIPEALGCLAPRRLALVGAPPPRSTARRRSTAAGAADRLERRPAPAAK